MQKSTNLFILFILLMLFATLNFFLPQDFAFKNQSQREMEEREQEQLSSRKIPKRIYQTHKFKKGKMPRLMKAAMIKIRRLHPDYEYEYFDDDAADEFMKESYGENSEEYFAYRCLDNPTFKADFFRYA